MAVSIQITKIKLRQYQINGPGELLCQLYLLYSNSLIAKINIHVLLNNNIIITDPPIKSLISEVMT